MTRPAATLPADAPEWREWQRGVDALHATYVRALTQLYESHKAAEGYGDVALVVE